MKKVYWIIIIIVGLAILAIMFLRGNEDTWIRDKNGAWVKHGNPEIIDFDSCAKKYPVMEIYPEQCAIPNGPSFTKQY